MRLLQKLTGIDGLKSLFDMCSAEKRDWYVGVYRHSDRNEVVCRKIHGHAISCFTSQVEFLSTLQYVQGAQHLLVT